MAPEAAHPFCKGNIIILFIFHVQILQIWSGVVSQSDKEKQGQMPLPNQWPHTVLPTKGSRETVSTTLSALHPPKPIPLRPWALSKHEVNPFSSLLSKVSFNLSITVLSNMTLPQGVGRKGNVLAAPHVLLLSAPTVNTNGELVTITCPGGEKTNPK